MRRLTGRSLSVMQRFPLVAAGHLCRAIVHRGLASQGQPGGRSHLQAPVCTGNSLVQEFS